MKNLIYKFGLGVFALMGLTSFNPFSEQIHLARLEGSTSLATTTVPTTQNSLFQRLYKQTSIGVWTGNPGFTFNSEDKKTKYAITSLRVTTTTTPGSSESDLDTPATAPTTNQTLNFCVREVSGSEGSVCVDGMDCVPLPPACGTVNINLVDLQNNSDEAKATLSLQAKNLIKDQEKRVTEELIAKRDQEKNCDYKTKSGKPNYDKIIECARDNYDKNYDNKAERTRYARKLKAAVMALAEDPGTSPEDIRSLMEDLEITGRDPELYKSITTAYKYSQLMQPAIYAYDSQEQEYRQVNIPEYYKLQVDNLVQRSMDLEAYGIYTDPRDLSNQIQLISKQYSMQLKSTFGLQTTSDPWGMNHHDYQNLLADYIHSIPTGVQSLDGNILSGNTFNDAYSDLNALMYPAFNDSRLARSGLTREGIRVTNNAVWDNSLCYDEMLGTNTRCGSSRNFDRLGTDTRGRGGLSNPQQWLNAAQRVGSVSSTNNWPSTSSGGWNTNLNDTNWDAFNN